MIQNFHFFYEFELVIFDRAALVLRPFVIYTTESYNL